MSNPVGKVKSLAWPSTTICRAHEDDDPGEHAERKLPRLVTGNSSHWRVIVQRAVGVASTADGRYLLRVGDTCVPVLGDDVGRLLTDRPGRPWETIGSGVRVSAADRPFGHVSLESGPLF